MKKLLIKEVLIVNLILFAHKKITIFCTNVPSELHSIRAYYSPELYSCKNKTLMKQYERRSLLKDSGGRPNDVAFLQSKNTWQWQTTTATQLTAVGSQARQCSSCLGTTVTDWPGSQD